MPTISPRGRKTLAVDANETLRGGIVADIKARVESGELTPGTQLPTLLDLCDDYGVSSITVRAALKELSIAGYIHSRRGSGIYVRVPQRRENSLSGEKVLALLVGVWDSPFYGGIIQGVEEECRRQGYRMVLSSSQYDPQLEAEYLKELAQQVAGLLIMPLASSRNYAAYAELLENKTPIVFVDSKKEGLAAPLVATDNEKGGFLATQHLLKMKRRPIYALCAQDLTSFQERLQGYRRALRAAKITPDESWVFTSSRPPQLAGYEMTRALLEQRNTSDPIGLFCLNDATARGAYVALKEAGLSIPHDVAVVGFDDADAAHFEPPLSSVRQNTRGLGASAAKTLLALLQPGQSKPRSEVRLEPQLMVRRSSDAQSVYCPVTTLTTSAEPMPVAV